jgi:hypothetical protein
MLHVPFQDARSDRRQAQRLNLADVQEDLCGVFWELFIHECVPLWLDVNVCDVYCNPMRWCVRVVSEL